MRDHPLNIAANYTIAVCVVALAALGAYHEGTKRGPVREVVKPFVIHEEAVREVMVRDEKSLSEYLNAMAGAMPKNVVESRFIKGATR